MKKLLLILSLIAISFTSYAGPNEDAQQVAASECQITYLYNDYLEGRVTEEYYIHYANEIQASINDFVNYVTGYYTQEQYNQFINALNWYRNQGCY